MDGGTSDAARDRSAIRTYLLLTLALSSVFWIVMIRAGTLGLGGGLYVLLLMWCPGVAGIATMLIHHRTMRGMGWRWGSTRDQLVSYSLPILYGGVVYGMVWATGLGRLDGQQGGVRFLALAATLGFVQSMISSTGEEIGWRGVLVPHLSRVTSFRNTGLVSGAVWAVWHWPILLFADYNAGTTWWYGLACFSIMVVGLSFVMAWLRLHSGSLWTGAILHATHNLYIQGVFDRRTVDTGPTEWIIGEFGIGLALALAAAGWVAWRYRDRVGPAPRPAAPRSTDVPVQA